MEVCIPLISKLSFAFFARNFDNFSASSSFKIHAGKAN